MRRTQGSERNEEGWDGDKDTFEKKKEEKKPLRHNRHLLSFKIIRTDDLMSK